MECSDHCGCGSACLNQRFQRRQNANISVIHTSKKGYGIRANNDIGLNEFIFEYIGEVINESTFRRRMMIYDKEGIKHFYFMSLNKGEFVDATRKGNLARFCNHSCNPNCYVDKWVVGDKVRMGIFSLREIASGEELLFNYNVDRYGADPQRCHCGEFNCQGFIGGKTQTDNTPKLSPNIMAALGLHSSLASNLPTKERHLCRPGTFDPAGLVYSPAEIQGEDDVTLIMVTLRQSQEPWVISALLSRLQHSHDEKAFNRVAKIHGYQILKSILSAWAQDKDIVMQALDVLSRLPRITRNKIQDSQIEDVVRDIMSRYHDDLITNRASELLLAWSKLEVGYRIPLVRRGPDSQQITTFPTLPSTYFDRRGLEPQPEPHPSVSLTNGLIPTEPKAIRAGIAFDGRTKQSNSTTRWTAPTGPRNNHRSSQGLMPSDTSGFTPGISGFLSRETSESRKLDAIIRGIVHDSKPTSTAPSADGPTNPHSTSALTSDSLVPTPNDYTTAGNIDIRIRKDMRLYENTLFPIIYPIMGKYKNKIPKDDLKRFGKEVRYLF